MAGGISKNRKSTSTKKRHEKTGARKYSGHGGMGGRTIKTKSDMYSGRRVNKRKASKAKKER